MYSASLKLIFTGLLFATFAFPCGKGLGEVRPGDKLVGIEIKDGKNGSKWLMDDDGILVISLVAAYCNNSIPYLRVDFTKEQEKCVDDLQTSLKVPYNDQLTTYSLSEKDKTKTEMNKKIKESCGFDIFDMWKKADEKRNAMPISCVDEVKGIIRKASIRSEEFLKEESDPKRLEKIDATVEQKKTYLAKLKADSDLVKKMNTLFSTKPVTIEKFEKWTEELSPLINNHAYQVVSNPDDKFDPENQVGLPDILFDVGAKLPGLASSKCGRFPVEIIKQLQSSTWEARGSGPGLQGGTKGTGEAGK